MKKLCVRIAYGSETVEKSVKMGRVGFLPGVSRTQVKAHARRQDPTYAGPFPCTQNLKNTPAYARTELRTQAQTHAITYIEAVLQHSQESIIQNQS